MSEEEKQHRATGRMSGWKRNRTHGWIITGKNVDDAFELNAEGNSEILKPFYDSFNSSLPEIPIRESVLKNLKKSYNISDHHAKIIGDVFYINREYLSYLLETVCHALLGDFASDSQEEFQDILNYFGMPEPEKISKTMFRLAIAKECLLRALQKECERKTGTISEQKKEFENAKDEMRVKILDSLIPRVNQILEDKTQEIISNTNFQAEQTRKKIYTRHKEESETAVDPAVVAELLMQFSYFQDKDGSLYRAMAGNNKNDKEAEKAQKAYEKRHANVLHTVRRWNNGENCPDWYLRQASRSEMVTSIKTAAENKHLTAAARRRRHGNTR